MQQKQSILRMFADVIAADPKILDDYDAAVAWLDEVAKNYSEMTFAYMANPYNTEHAIIMNNGWVPDSDYKVEERQWYIDTERSGDGYSISAPYFDAQTGLYCITFSRIVYSSDGEFLGIFAIDCLLDKLIDAQVSAVKDAASVLTQSRRTAAAELERQVVTELRALAMPAVRFQVEISPVGGIGFKSSGADEVRFLMSANAGEAPGRISKIASGGELSRIMLALKNVFAQRDAVPSMVFDEVDTGVSGVAAQRVGEKLATLSAVKQVICITHLSQIAAMADHHFLIEKHQTENRTWTSVDELDPNGRAAEIARLHGGDRVSELTLASANEQLASAEEFKKQRTNREA